jgi:hypothetical protein
MDFQDIKLAYFSFLNMESKSTSKIEPQKKRKTLIESPFLNL